jgi:hypothetical protein
VDLYVQLYTELFLTEWQCRITRVLSCEKKFLASCEESKKPQEKPTLRKAMRQRPDTELNRTIDYFATYVARADDMAPR